MIDLQMLNLPGFSDPTAIALVILFAILFFAGLVHGILGLGFPLIATPLIALMSDVRSAILVILLPTLVINIASVIKGGRWKESIGRYWPLAAYGVVGSVLGTRLLIVTDPAPYKLLLAVMILVYLNVNRIGLNLGWVRNNPSLAYAIFGTLGGLLAGTVNVMLPALIIFALEMGLATTVMVQVFNFCFFFGKISQAFVFAAAGALTGPILISTTPLAGVTLGALFVGMAVRERVNPETYKRWLRRVLYIIVALLAVQYFSTDL